MVRVLIVDDEVIIRKGIINSIDWKSFDINIAGEASNGREALELATKLRPDIVITDIKMPVMDGLELSRNLRGLLPSVKLVILTGYGEFEYAKKAIEFNVSEFILKPVGAEKLLKIVLRLKDEIIEKEKKENMQKFNELLLQENLPVIKEKLISRLINGKLNDSDKTEFIKTIKVLDMDFSGPLYQAFVMVIDDYFFTVGNKASEKGELILDSVHNISQEYLKCKAKGYLCRNEGGYFIGIINTDNYTFDIIDMCRNIQFLLKKHLKIYVSIGIGNKKHDIFSVYQSYEEAFIALRNRIYMGKSVVIHINDIKRNNDLTKMATAGSSIGEEKELLNCLKLIDRDKANKLLDRIFKRFISVKADYNSIKNVSLKLLLASFRATEEMGIDIEDRLEIQIDIFQEIEKYETAEDIKNWLKDVIAKLIKIIENEKDESYKTIVKVAIDYIIKKYNKPLSLTDIADKVNVTPGYLCRVFKEETGQSCMDWLNKYRIDKAKELLKDVSLKTYEVAEIVGFNDYKHFSYNFKKYVGCSATEYMSS